MEWADRAICILSMALKRASNSKLSNWSQIKDRLWMETLGRLVNRNMRGPDWSSRDSMVIKWAYEKLKSDDEVIN